MKSWKHAPPMGFTCIKSWKAMHKDYLGGVKPLIHRLYKPYRVCYEVLIIGGNTLVTWLLKVIIVLNSVRASLFIA